MTEMAGMIREPTGHVFRVERRRGPAWFAKYHLPDGRQVQKKIGARAWTGRGRPLSGYFTKRTTEAWLRAVLDAAGPGPLAGAVPTGATFRDAAPELRFIEEDRERKPSTLTDYRSALESHLLPAFGTMPLEDVTSAQVEAWRRTLNLNCCIEPKGAAIPFRGCLLSFDQLGSDRWLNFGDLRSLCRR